MPQVGNRSRPVGLILRFVGPSMVRLQDRCAAAVQPAYDELAARLPAEPVLNIDGSAKTEASAKAWVWTVVASTFTFFACRTSHAGDVLANLLGESYGGVIHCDKARMDWRSAACSGAGRT